jgi:hypothetical protein
MSFSREDIVNLALVELGEPPITSLATDTSKPAKVMRAIYETAVKSVLRAHPWRCAQKRTRLASDPTVDTTEIEFSFACLLPGDFVSMVLVNDPLTHFKRAGRHLLCDDNAPWVIYIARVPEEEFDPGLVMCIAAQLAALSCFAITDNASLRENLEKVYLSRLADARRADALDGVADEPQPGELELARY